ncbi:unnamed protein product [Didymodactylos carnosus]|uniref:Alpha-mannosidase n=1 Tax=Didymodactylos carnosus TaxID=1234261 RepID=A0A8S2E6G5_9BILA|nr:unnamed protein product [Didymodactylos carnosus]CAF3839928.1 unnamed protein product [Didymodactylos carnosus]
MLQSNQTTNQRDSKEFINRLNALEDSIRELQLSVKDVADDKFKYGKDNELIQRDVKQEILTNKPEIKHIDHDAEEKPEQVIESKSNPQCAWRASPLINTTFEMRQLYETLPFDDVDGGVWKQGFDITYQQSQWTDNNKLKIILMPHSHCDPGWIYTFEDYFNQETKNIIDTIITALSSNSKYKFVWAEISYLHLWWEQASNEKKELCKKLVNNGQLEIVTGGWVMNDEANTHYYAMIDQLIEGHQWIENHLGDVKLKNGWANDPFGYSPTMAYLLQRMGIEHMAIQRVHYHVKKSMAKEKKLEFLWRQAWDRSASTDILCHVMPFYSYDIPHTCGPDPRICCQFDFKRVLASDISCPWGIAPVQITDSNVEQRALLLLDQYRKKSQLYQTNVLFVQLGDDFRYGSANEASKQFGNYEKLFNYMNRRSDWSVDAQFGTLNDYFEQLQLAKKKEEFPSYAGDFFTYADRNDHYWSGYYTSRSFFKRLDRIVESYLRATEILFSNINLKISKHKIDQERFPMDKFYTILSTARRNLALFQHHDGITGTAKDHVVNDYGEKLLVAIRSCHQIIEESISFLIFDKSYSFLLNQTLLTMNSVMEKYDGLPQRKLITMKTDELKSKTVYIYNPTDQQRIEIVKVIIDTYNVQVKYQTLDASFVSIQCQIDPKWTGKRSNTFSSDTFELLFLVDIEPYTVKSYIIQYTDDNPCPMSTIEYTDKKHIIQPNTPFKLSSSTTKAITIENNYLICTFSKSGLLLNIKRQQHQKKTKLNVNIIRYGTDSKSNSGAYLFLPDGVGKEVPSDSDVIVRIQHGKLVSRVDVLDKLYGLQYKLANTDGLDRQILEIGATTFLTMNSDIELALRLSSNINNGQVFFTDLNGFQIIQRKTYDKLPLQANVYPMSSMSFIQDDQFRLTVISAQPSGVASLKTGLIDVFLDRRLLRDDNRGLGQGVMDNREIVSVFKILIENRKDMMNVDQNSLTGYPSLLAHHLSMQLLYPMHTLQMTKSSSEHPSSNKINLFSNDFSLPGDVHLVNFRTLNDNLNDEIHVSKSMALILRKFSYDCVQDYDNLYQFNDIKFENIFVSEQIETIHQTSLSLRHTKKELNITSKLIIPVAEIVTYRIKIR